jgi:hypothetical protein
MALIRNIEYQSLERAARHSEVECTYDVIIDPDGRKYLQLDTYGSTERQIKGKKSQSLRLTPEAISQLKEIIAKHAL